MNIDDALSFLSQHQPLPKELFLSNDLVDQYTDVLKFFLQHDDSRCISLFLNSFGDFGGLKEYKVVEEIIMRYPAELVVPILIKNIQAEFEPISYWNCQIASNFNANNLIKPLIETLFSAKTFQVKSAALIALSTHDVPVVRISISQFIKTETDQESIDFANKILTDSIDKYS